MQSGCFSRFHFPFVSRVNWNISNRVWSSFEKVVWKAPILRGGSLPHLTFWVDKRSLFMAVKFLVFVKHLQVIESLPNRFKLSSSSWKRRNFIQWCVYEEFYKWAKESLVLLLLFWLKKNDWIIINMERKYRYKIFDKK